MDPLTLLSVAPSIIRGIGSLFGGKTKEVADSVANVADAVKGKSPQEQKDAMAQHLASMTPDQQKALGDLQVQLEKVKAEQREAELTAESADYAEAQKTIRAQDTSDDPYVRQTRPKMARISTYTGLGYVGLLTLVQIVAKWQGHEAPNIDNYILGTLLAPATYYMTMRTIDKAKQYKQAKGDGHSLTSAVTAMFKR